MTRRASLLRLLNQDNYFSRIMDWQSPEIIQLPAKGVAHIWRLDMEVNAFQREQWFKLLSTEEQQRSGIKNTHRRQEYIETRAQLRLLISAYLHIPPDDLLLINGEHGKPYLSDRQNPHNLRFNLSHSGNCVLLAFACNADVGIDVETIKPKPYLEIAHRFYHEQEYHFLASLSETQGLKDFFRYWTIKEAVLKAMGTGLQYGLNKIVLREPLCSREVFALHTSGVTQRDWEIHRLALSDQLSSAIALEGDGWKIDFFSPDSLF